jgi:hypothetical protein
LLSRSIARRKIFAPVFRPTAKIKTAERKNVVAIPIQALAVRSRKDIEDAKKNSKGGSSGSVTLGRASSLGSQRSEKGRNSGSLRRNRQKGSV